jgi:hypothetical protein
LRSGCRPDSPPEAGSPGAGKDLVGPPAEQEGVGALEDLVEERRGLVVEERYGPSATLESAPAAMEARGMPDAPRPDLPPAKDGSKTKNVPAPETRAQYARLLGIDLVAVMVLSASSVQTIISEIGTDMECFPSVKHLCAWLGLAPRNDNSGAKVLR